MSNGNALGSGTEPGRHVEGDGLALDEGLGFHPRNSMAAWSTGFTREEAESQRDKGLGNVDLHLSL